MFTEGQAFIGKIPFKDGCIPLYERFYLIVDVDKIAKKIKILNVSSLSGKVHKLAYSTNKNLTNYDPPFSIPTFVKLDSLIEVDFYVIDINKIVAGGRTLDSIELNDIRKSLDL